MIFQLLILFKKPWNNHNARIQQSLEKSDNSIDNSLRVGADTEAVAENIISNLGKQRYNLKMPRVM